MPHSWRSGKLQTLEHELGRLYSQIIIWKRQTDSRNNDQLKAMTSKLDELTCMVVKLNHLEMYSDDSSESMIFHGKKTTPKIFLTHEATQTPQQPLVPTPKESFDSIEESLILSEAQTSQAFYGKPRSYESVISEQCNVSELLLLTQPMSVASSTVTESQESMSVISEKLYLKIYEVNERLNRLLESSLALDDQISRERLSRSWSLSETENEGTINPIRGEPSKFERLETLKDEPESETESKEVSPGSSSSKKPPRVVVRILSKPEIASSEYNGTDPMDSVESGSSLEGSEQKLKKLSKRAESRSLPSITDSSDSMESRKALAQSLRGTRSSFQQPLPSDSSKSSFSPSLTTIDEETEIDQGNVKDVLDLLTVNKLIVTPSRFQQVSPSTSSKVKLRLLPKAKPFSDSSATRTQHDAFTDRLVLAAITFLILSLGTYVVWYA